MPSLGLRHKPTPPARSWYRTPAVRWAGVVMFAWLSMATRCNIQTQLHLRYHLAWCIGPTPPPEQSWFQVQTNTAPLSYRLEGELRMGPGQKPVATIAWVDIAQQTSVRREPLSLPAKPTRQQLQTQIMALQTPAYRARFQRECKQLQGGPYTFQWRRQGQSKHPLTTLSMPLQLPGIREDFQLIYQEKREDERHLIALQLKGTTHSWPLRAALSFPQDARLVHIDCLKSQCLLELRYDMAAHSQFSQLLRFVPSKVAARLIHARGYQRHDRKQFVKARQDFAQAWKLDPNYADAGYNLACSLALSGGTKAAARVLHKLLAQTTAYHKLACTDLDLKDLRQPYAYLFAHCPKKQKTPKQKP